MSSSNTQHEKQHKQTSKLLLLSLFTQQNNPIELNAVGKKIITHLYIFSFTLPPIQHQWEHKQPSKTLSSLLPNVIMTASITLYYLTSIPSYGLYVLTPQYIVMSSRYHNKKPQRYYDKRQATCVSIYLPSISIFCLCVLTDRQHIIFRVANITLKTS